MNAPSGFTIGEAGRKIQTGVDEGPGLADGELVVNWFHSWELGDDFQANEYDFKSTIYHELTHMLGFTTAAQNDGTTSV